MQKVRFVGTQKPEFFATVRKRVDAYFQENQLSRNANGAMWIKAVFFLTGMGLFYGLILSNLFSPLNMLLFAVLLGMFTAFVAFNICHDAIHGAFSRNRKTNQMLGLIFNVIGANAYVWNITHNIVHHTYTNIPDHDEDLDVAPGIIRLSADEKLKGFQRFQHLYAFPLYGLASLSWVFRKDYMKFFQKKIGNSHDNTNHPRKAYLELFLFKAVYYMLFLVIPLLVVNVTWWQFLIGFLAMHLAEGLVLGLVFQLAHVVEGTHFPEPDENGRIEEVWAIHQMQTTANFARKSWLAGFLCGGLNMQIEHHLFPKVCHIHYPALSEIVKQTAHEFDLPYYEAPTFLTALQSHYRILRRYGKEAYEKNQLERVAVAVAGSRS